MRRADDADARKAFVYYTFPRRVSRDGDSSMHLLSLEAIDDERFHWQVRSQGIIRATDTHTWWIGRRSTHTGRDAKHARFEWFIGWVFRCSYTTVAVSIERTYAYERTMRHGRMVRRITRRELDPTTTRTIRKNEYQAWLGRTELFFCYFFMDYLTLPSHTPGELIGITPTPRELRTKRQQQLFNHKFLSVDWISVGVSHRVGWHPIRSPEYVWLSLHVRRTWKKKRSNPVTTQQVNWIWITQEMYIQYSLR